MKVRFTPEAEIRTSPSSGSPNHVDQDLFGFLVDRVEALTTRIVEKSPPQKISRSAPAIGHLDQGGDRTRSVRLLDEPLRLKIGEPTS